MSREAYYFKDIAGVKRRDRFEVEHCGRTYPLFAPVDLRDVGIGRSETVFVGQCSMGGIRSPLRIVICRVARLDLHSEDESIRAGGALHESIIPRVGR
jgi:hypothetical protein